MIGEVRNQMLEADIPIEYSKGEAGVGQHEVNVTYGGALETADRHLVFKSGVKEIAEQHGRAVTFMAKWSMEAAGSSCHLHASLWDATGDRPLMAPADGASSTSGFSELGEQFVAGQLYAARQLAWCFASYLNSYRRYVPDSWAPTAVAWGEDNRTCGFRAVGSGPGRRIESRIPGADVNPYVALAAAIAAGLYGIDHDLELPPAFTGNAYLATELEPHSLVARGGAERARVEQGGGRGIRARPPSPPGEHRPPGVGGVEPGRHRLGARPQLRADLSPSSWSRHSLVTQSTRVVTLGRLGSFV